MKPVSTVSGRAYPWGAKNVDTDVIIPAHWLKTITRTGMITSVSTFFAPQG